MKNFKGDKYYGFRDQDICLNKISKLDYSLEKLNTGINFKIFRSLMEDVKG
jgi:hypothetical protein